MCLARGCQRVANIGEVLTPHDLPTIGAVILVNPGVALSTKDVFDSFAQSKKNLVVDWRTIIHKTANIVGLGNDLTETAASSCHKSDAALMN